MYKLVNLCIYVFMLCKPEQVLIKFDYDHYLQKQQVDSTLTVNRYNSLIINISKN